MNKTRKGLFKSMGQLTDGYIGFHLETLRNRV